MRHSEGKLSKSPCVAAQAGKIKSLANLRILTFVNGSLGTSFLEILASILLSFATANLLTVLITGGYMVTLGPFQMRVHHLRDPLLLFLLLSMVKVWLRGRRLEIPPCNRLRSPLLLFLIVVSIYSLAGRTRTSDDAIPARYLPLSILREFDFDFDEFPHLYEPRVPYYFTKSNGHVVSTHPPWAGLLALPVYLLPVLGGQSSHSHLLPEIEKLSATVISALSVLLLFFALRRITQEKHAWLIALVYAFGTSSFSTSSQALWQHGPSQLFLSLMIYLLVRGLEESRFSAYAGFALAGAIICRPVNALIAPPVVAYILQKRRDKLFRFAFCALPLLLLFMGYNYYYFGSPLTTGVAAFIISPTTVWRDRSLFFGLPLWDGLMGVFLSPGRGLLIYSPILLFSFIGMAMVWRAPSDVLFRYLSLSPLLVTLLTCKWGMWWGGHSYGPRLLADLAPIFCLFLYPPFERSEAKPPLRYALASLAALSIVLHALGAFSDGSWNDTPTNVDDHPERLWSWAASPPVYYLDKSLTDAGHTLSTLLPTPTPRELAAQTFVSRIYQEGLGRAPDPDELESWTGFLTIQCNTMGFGVLADNVFDSAELWTSRPLTPGTLVTILYRAFLGRDPEPVGLAYWGTQVRLEGPRLAVQGFLPSAEFHSWLPDRSNQAAVTQVVTRFYTELLGRNPDPDGLAYWVNHVAVTHDTVGPAVAFLTSAEFENRAVPLQRYIMVLYRAFLGRDPDREGLEFWVERLRADLHAIIHRAFISSEEFQRFVTEVCEGPS